MRRDIALSFAVNVTAFEDRGRVAEDEIHMSLDVAVFVVLSPAVRKQRVLPAKKATVAKDNPIRIDVNGDRLRTGAVGVFKRKVLSAKVATTNIRAVRKSRVSRSLGAQIERQRSLHRVFALKGDERFCLRNLHLLFVCARLDVNDKAMQVKFGNVIDRLLHCLEVSRSIGCDDRPVTILSLDFPGSAKRSWLFAPSV